MVLPPLPIGIAIRQDLAHSRRPPPPPPPRPPLPGSRIGGPPPPPPPPPPPRLHQRRGAVDLGRVDLTLTGQAQNMNRMRVAHAGHLSRRVTDKDYLAPIIAAFATITQDPGFAKCLDDEVGWTNFSAWFDWAIRAIAPEIGQRPIAEELRDSLRARSLTAGQNGKIFYERYLFELSLYCDAAIEKMDTSFIFGQASMIFGPILGPLLAVPAAAAQALSGPIAGMATSASVSIGKKLVETGLKAGINAALVDVTPQKVVKKYENLDPMRFSLAWLDFVTSHNGPAVTIIHNEFGGKRGCVSMYEWLKSSNL